MDRQPVLSGSSPVSFSTKNVARVHFEISLSPVANCRVAYKPVLPCCRPCLRPGQQFSKPCYFQSFFADSIAFASPKRTTDIVERSNSHIFLRIFPQQRLGKFIFNTDYYVPILSGGRCCFYSGRETRSWRWSPLHLSERSIFFPMAEEHLLFQSNKSTLLSDILFGVNIDQVFFDFVLSASHAMIFLALQLL